MRFTILLAIASLQLTPWQLLAAPKSSAKPMPKQSPKLASPQSIELDTLRIEGNIYEPQVLFILEEPNLDLLGDQEKEPHDFLEDFDQPLRELLY